MLFSRPNDEYSEKMKSETKCICPYKVCDETCLCHAGSRPFLLFWYLFCVDYYVSLFTIGISYTQFRTKWCDFPKNRNIFSQNINISNKQWKIMKKLTDIRTRRRNICLNNRFLCSLYAGIGVYSANVLSFGTQFSVRLNADVNTKALCLK